MKKKYSLAIGMAICFAVYVLLSWIIPTAVVSGGTLTEGTTNPVGIFGLAYYPAFTIGTFIQFGLMILTIGGFYGVLTKTGVYSKLVNSLVKRIKGKEKLFLILVAISYMVLNSVMGSPYALLITVPFMMEVLLMAGYDKLTVTAATVGAILVGSLCSTFGYNVAGTATYVMGVSIKEGLIPRLIIFVLIGVLFVLFLRNKPLSKKKEEDVVLFATKEVKKNAKSTTPLILVSSLIIIIGIISMFNWSSVFNIKIFETFFENVNDIKIGTYPILENLFGLTNPFGYWDSYELAALLIIGSLVMGWVYSINIKDIFEGFIEGAKKLIKPAMYVTMANLVFMPMLAIVSDGTMLTWIANKLTNITEEFNLLSVLGSSIIGPLFYNHYYYLFNTLMEVFNINFGATMNVVMSLSIQTLYGIIMLILPTSTILVAGLSTLDVSYKDWIKYIWRLLLEMFLIVVVVLALIAII